MFKQILFKKMGKYLKLFKKDTDYLYFKKTTDFILPNVSHCIEENHVHYNPIDPYNGHQYVEIGGIKWATMNIGANSITDTGLYFQWGDTQGYTAAQVGDGEGQKYFSQNDCIYYNDGSYTKYNEGDSKNTLEASDDAVTAAWGGNWRMPTVSEFIALGEAVNSAWTDNYQGSGVAGMIYTDKTDETKTLFFPACGSASNGSVNNVGSDGSYWSSWLSGDYYGVSYVYGLNCNNDGVNWQYNFNRCNGLPVRGVLAEN